LAKRGDGYNRQVDFGEDIHLHLLVGDDAKDHDDQTDCHDGVGVAKGASNHSRRGLTVRRFIRRDNGTSKSIR